MLRNIKLVRIEQTLDFCPSEWDAYDSDGDYYYIRYRYGFLSVNKGEIMGESVFARQVKDHLSGVMSTEEMLRITGFGSEQ